MNIKDNKVKASLLSKKMTRKQAIKKAGVTVTALTAASLSFLETKAQAQDSQGRPAGPPDRGR